MPDDSARQEILLRIQKAVGSPSADSAQRDWNAIPREYRRDSLRSRPEVLDLFVERLRDYGADVVPATSAGLNQAIGRRLAARRVQRVLLPDGFPETLLPSGFVYVRDHARATGELDACEGVLTESTLAIAETGTIVLQSVAGQGRRAVSLVPDYHLCLVKADCVKATVPEAISELGSTASLPTTFISGPSATADIEMTRIQGVHGPRILDVILIDD